MKNLAIGIQNFRELRINNGFYLDKTKQIYSLLADKNQRHYFFSRPRRFGKSLMLSTIKHLFLGDKELFTDLYIADKWDFTETNPVLHLSFSSYSGEDLTEFIKNTGTVSYPKNGQLIEKKLGEYTKFSLLYFLEEIYKETGKATAIIVDEYDKPVLAHLQNVEKAEAVREFFAGFYGPVKDNDKYIRLFLLTGLTKLMKMSVFSVLNNLVDITFLNDYADLIGYTQAELEANFEPEIRAIAEKRKQSYPELIEQLKVEYNGFNFSDEHLTLYNPWDINNFIAQRQLKYYWSDTGIPSAISNYIKNNVVDVQAMIDAIKNNELVITETELRVQDLSQIKAEVLFLNSGYLTIKSIAEDNFYYLGFPNRETEQVMFFYFLNLVGRNKSLPLFQWKKTSDQIVKAIFAKNSTELETAIHTLIYEVLVHVSYEWVNKNPEGWLKTMLGVAIRMNSIYYWAEPQNLLGRADFHIPKDGNIFVVEVKVNESTKKAIAQIDDKYTAQYQQEYVQVIKVGINWNKKKKKVEVMINE